MKSHIPLHLGKLGALLIAFVFILSVNVWVGDLKVMADITWIDIFGEGSTLGLMLMFLAFVLISRPRGQVTTLLSIGLIGFSASIFQDILDEIIVMPTGFLFGDFVESILAPIAVVILGYGFYQWHQEQLTINQKLMCRERFYREHSALDYVTDLYTALYMKEQIDRELILHRSEQKPLSVLMIDIANFDAFNRRYGEDDGDRLLAQAAKLITLNLRNMDLACRYAGDRFIVLFPGTHLVDARVYQTEILNALQNLAFKPSNAARSEFIACNSSLIDHSYGENSTALIQAANDQLEHLKQQNNKSIAA